MTAGTMGGLARVPVRLRDDRWLLLGLLGLAALLRCTDLATRGTWDGDQGHDLLVLRALVRDGDIPLLGPPTSIGEVHHGAWYYYLLAPAAFLTAGDSPTAVVALIALAGVAAVGVTWWLARAVAGPVAGAVAGLLLATSAAAIDGSTFVWNPNLIALSSAVALLGTWRAWQGGDTRWWLVAAIGTVVTMQCHVLGAALLPIVGVPFVLDARRRPLGRIGAGIALVALVAYAPLIANELTTDGSETRALLDYLGGGRDTDGAALPIRLAIVGLRVVSWPLAGLLTAAVLPAMLAALLVVGIAAAPWRSLPAQSRRAIRWAGLGLAWCAIALAVAAPSLASVVPGLPNDHYHAFADPLVVLLVALGLTGMAGAPPSVAALPVSASRVPALVATAILVAIVAWNLTHLPPAVHPDGGFPAEAEAADRVLATLRSAGVAADDPVRLTSIPDFKSTEALAYPLVRAGQAVQAETPREGLAPGSVDGSAPALATLVLCDDLFAEADGAPCGGPAEDARFGASLGEALDRVEAHPGRWVSVYRGTVTAP